MRKTVLLQILTGSIMVISGAIILIILLLADRTLSISCGLGLFAGAMTSTPSLAAAKEAAGIQASAAVAGYGVTYLPGVISIVLFVQIENRHNPQFINTIPRVPSVFRPLDLILPLGIILPGMLLGALPIPGTGITIGNSGGILLISLICGQFSIFRSVSSDALAFLRTLGLIFFLVGAGIPAGASFMEYIKPVYLLYGLMMSLIPAILGYLFTRIFLKYGLSDSLSLVSGGRTSTPAISALADSGKASFSCYAYAYCGALLTLLMVVKSLYLIFI